MIMMIALMLQHCMTCGNNLESICYTTFLKHLHSSRFPFIDDDEENYKKHRRLVLSKFSNAVQLRPISLGEWEIPAWGIPVDNIFTTNIKLDCGF